MSPNNHFKKQTDRFISEFSVYIMSNLPIPYSPCATDRSENPFALRKIEAESGIVPKRDLHRQTNSRRPKKYKHWIRSLGWI